MEESHTLKVVFYEKEERPLHGKKEINCMQEVGGMVTYKREP